jgi:inosine-uridine nucleoside N-ribohydrolase
MIGPTELTSHPFWLPTLQLAGNVNIISDKLVLQQVTLDVVKEAGLQVATAGTFLDIPVTISAHIPNNKESQYSVALTATDVNLATVLTNIQDSVGVPKIPDILLNFVRPITFTDITIAYGNPEADASTKAVLTIAATPAISDVPVLKSSAEFLGLSPDDFFFAVGYRGLDLGVNHTSIVALPSPFTKDGVVLFSLMVSHPCFGLALCLLACILLMST